jgi:hypothetical protein
MFTAKQYRAKAAEYTGLLKAASLPAETREFRRLEQSYLTLAENEEWMADNREKIHSPGADNNWYGDAILAQQGKHTLGWHRADVATQSTAMPAKIQQLFDDAGLGGLLQTATLRRQIARFLHKQIRSTTLPIIDEIIRAGATTSHSATTSAAARSPRAYRDPRRETSSCRYRFRRRRLQR